METIEFDKQPIEKALEDWGAEITGINTLLGCCELLAGLAEEATEAGSGGAEDAAGHLTRATQHRWQPGDASQAI